MSVCGTRTKHAGYTIRTPAEKESNSVLYLTSSTNGVVYQSLRIYLLFLPTKALFLEKTSLLSPSSLLYDLLYIEDLGEGIKRALYVQAETALASTCYYLLLSFCFIKTTENVLFSITPD